MKAAVTPASLRRSVLSRWPLGARRRPAPASRSATARPRGGELRPELPAPLPGMGVALTGPAHRGRTLGRVGPGPVSPPGGAGRRPRLGSCTGKVGPGGVWPATGPGRPGSGTMFSLKPPRPSFRSYLLPPPQVSARRSAGRPGPGRGRGEARLPGATGAVQTCRAPRRPFSGRSPACGRSLVLPWDGTLETVPSCVSFLLLLLRAWPPTPL